MAKKRITNPVVRDILKDMCKIAGVKYGEINWKDGSHMDITWTIGQRNKFVFLLADKIYKMKANELEQLVGKYHRLYYRRKKKAFQIAKEFSNNFGFRVK